MSVYVPSNSSNVNEDAVNLKSFTGFHHENCLYQRGAAEGAATRDGPAFARGRVVGGSSLRLHRQKDENM